MKFRIQVLVCVRALAVWGGNVVAAAASSGQPSYQLHLQVPAGYLPGIPFLARVELRQADGTMAREVWNAAATLSTPTPGLTLSTNRVLLYNGLGSHLVTAAGGDDFTLAAAMDDLSAHRSLVSLVGVPTNTVAGTLAGTSTEWSNIVLVTADVTVPAGHTLTILPGTWILFNGVASGTGGPDLQVSGTVQSLGTAEEPVTFTCAQPGLRWGQIRHNSAPPALYRHTMITLAGRAPGEGHTGQAPVIRAASSQITFDGCSLTDHAETTRGATDFGRPGKIASGSSGASLVFTNGLLARARMGPEIGGTALDCVDTWFIDMRGPDDADGIYLHNQQAGQVIRLAGCVLAGGDDDGIDTLSSTITVEDCILRDWDNRLEDAKAISVFNGATHVRRCLIVDSTVGVAAKAHAAPTTALATLDHCTLAGNLTNLWVNKKSNAPGPDVRFNVTNCVLWDSPKSLISDFEPASAASTNFAVGYGVLSEPWAGPGHVWAEPQFADAASHDYDLLPFSPAIDAGDPTAPPDPDGSPTDIGCFTFAPPPPRLGLPQWLPDGNAEVPVAGYTNRYYRLERSDDFQSWQPVGMVFQAAPEMRIPDRTATNRPVQLYRAILGP